MKAFQMQPFVDVLKIGVLKNFAIFTGKHLWPVLESLFNKVAGFKACNFTKKRLKNSQGQLLDRTPTMAASVNAQLWSCIH